MSTTMMTYINKQSKVIPDILQNYQQELLPIINFINLKKIKKILILATGSSYNAALCTRYYFMQQCGLLADIKQPYNFAHYEIIDPDIDVAIAISQSGKSASTIDAQKKVKSAGIPVFSLTSDPYSPIAQSSDGILNINIGIETVGFVTLGFTATIVNLLIISSIIALAQNKISQYQLTDLLNSLDKICMKLPEVIQKTELFIHHNQNTFLTGKRFIAIAYGSLEGVAHEFETKFTETIRLPASGFELETYMHGPYLEANKDHILFFIEDKDNARLHRLRDYMKPYVNSVFTLNSASSTSTDNTLAYNVPIEHNLAPVLLIVPVQVMAYRIATIKNIDLSVRIFDDFDDVLKSKI